MSIYSYVCYKCGEKKNGIPTLGYNLGFGVFEFCETCETIKNKEEIITLFKNVMNPQKEKGDGDFST